MQNSFFLKEPFVDILEEPKKNSNISSQLIYGESFKIISKKGTILCDDWNLSQALGVREAIKDFSKEQNVNFEIVHERFAQFNL